MDIQRRDDAIVRGFLKDFGENIRDACEEKLYQDLEHARFGNGEVWPEEYMVEVKRYCPLNVQTIKEAKEHLFRGWARLDKDRPETIKRFGVRLKMAQDSLRCSASPCPVRMLKKITCWEFTAPKSSQKRSSKPSISWTLRIKIEDNNKLF